jgi:prolyl oligopeptidase
MPLLSPLRYPTAHRADVVEELHGERVADPYRWLEDPDSEETRAWIEAEQRLTKELLGSIGARAAIRSRLEELWSFERFGIPVKEGGRYFYFHNRGLQNQPVLYTCESLSGPARVLLDPNEMSADGTVAIGGLSISDDGLACAYGVQSAGSDWTEWRVRDVATGKDRPDLIRFTKWTGAAWERDGSGFYYSRFPEPEEGAALTEQNFHNKLYFHRLGTAQAEDRLIYERPDEKEWSFGGGVTEDGRYLVISVSKGTNPENLVLVQARGQEQHQKQSEGATEPPIRTLFGEWDAEWSYIGNDGPRFLFKTNKDAPRGRVVAVNVDDPSRQLTEIVPESSDRLEGVAWMSDRLLCVYLHDAHSAVRLHHPDGRPAGAIALPGLCTASGFSGRRHDTETFYAVDRFTAPATIYRYDLLGDASSVFRAPALRFDPDLYETHQLFARSKDGTRVPLFVTGKKGTPHDGNTPTFLYGYGGFDISLTPGFSVSALAWMERGGLYAVANLRGGGEYGRDWHRAGTLERKQNVFDDFLACAEHLYAEGWTRPARLGIGGASNGGLLVAASITQHPERFGAAVAEVGVHDMLRFHKFTIGWAWVDDYGSADDPALFKVLRAYSPVHNVRSGPAYPATLLVTADHDDRVVPGHSFKLAAALQAAQTGDAPILIRIETKAGHGAGKPLAKVMDEAADKWAFLGEILTGGDFRA